MSAAVTLHTRKGQPFVVDAADADAVVAAGPWRLKRHHGLTYIQRNVRLDGNRKPQSLHRFLMNPGSASVDHRNHDGTDNRRENLRLASSVDQMRNTRPRIARALPKGVTSHPLLDGTLRYSTRIRTTREQVRIGYFSTAEDAAIAYDCGAAYLFGEFAYGNGSELPERLPEVTESRRGGASARLRTEIDAWLAERATVEVAA